MYYYIGQFTEIYRHLQKLDQHWRSSPFPAWIQWRGRGKRVSLIPMQALLLIKSLGTSLGTSLQTCARVYVASCKMFRA